MTDTRHAASPSTDDPPAAERGAEMARLFLASVRQLPVRLIVSAVMAAAVAPFMDPHLLALWLMGLAVISLAELNLARLLRRGHRFKLFVLDAPLQMVAITYAAGLNYVALATLAWLTGAAEAMVFAAVLLSMALLYILIQLYTRPRSVLIAAAPTAIACAAGLTHMAWRSWQAGHPLGVLTALMTGVMLAYSLALAHKNLFESYRALQAAKAEALERGHAAETANRAKSAFLATMSHEIRTPLNGVLGMVQAMGAEEMTASQHERLVVIRQSGEALLAILNDILDLSKIEAGKLELEDIAFDLGEIAHGAGAAFTVLAEAKDLAFSCETDPAALGTYRGDPTRVRQILYNLVSNAVKFTHAGQVTVTIARPDETLVMQVRDTGEGIAPDRLQTLFDKFVQADSTITRRFGGTGLGLSICQELAERMGGAITVESVVGEGSTFTVRLPLPRLGDAVVPAPAAPEPVPATAEERGALRILAAEDNPTNRLVLTTLLGQVGLTVTAVDDGAKAVAAIQAGEWDLVLMDVQMPVMDGLAATQAIRRWETQSGRARTPIIALTANAMHHQIQSYLAAGMDGHVAKPIQAALLFAAIEQALRAAETGERAA